MRYRTKGAVAVALGTAVAAVVAVGASAVESHDGGSGQDAGDRGTANAASATGSKAGDINGDGYADLAVGAPDGTVGGKAKAGYVAVTYGSKSGVDVDKSALISQSTAGVPGTPEGSDHFGSTVAVGDVDGDGYADLVIGAPAENIGSTKDAGSVTVVFGSQSGLTKSAIAFHAPKVTAYQRFGDTLALGDYNHDGRQDIAISDGTKADIVYGKQDLRATPTPSMTSVTPPGGGAGITSLHSGDVNGDGYADLVTVAYEDDPADEGTLGVLAGSKDGLASKGLGKAIGLPFADYSAVVGDVNGDGKDDVVIDTAAEDGPDDYKLRTFPGTASGLDGDHAVAWQGPAQSGEAITSADVNGDGHADVVVADTDAPDSDGIQQAGALTVLRGSDNWLTATGKQTISLDTKGVLGVAEGGDEFGADVSPADYNGDNLTDLAVGAPGKQGGNGAVSMLYADPGKTGITPTGSILFDPTSIDAPADQASFGEDLGRIGH